MEVICIEEESFYSLVDKVVDRMKREHGDNHWKWVDDVEAMRLLNITSKTTLQEFRDNGKIRFSQPRKRIILYDRDSINEFLEQNARETF